MPNVNALAQAGYTQPKESYSTAELSRLSTSHLRRVAREQHGVYARRHQYDTRNIPWDCYWVMRERNVLAEIPAGEDDLREWLIGYLAD